MNFTRKTFVAIVGLGVFTVAAGSALAEPHGRGIGQRMHNQHERIEQGIRSGELTRSEARQLGTEQRAIRREERQYKSDGVLTKAERKDLQQDLNVAGKDIYNQKHDAERR